MKKKTTSKKIINEMPSADTTKLSICEIRDLNQLNELGCHFINTANHTNTTRIITRSMRWLTVKHGNQCMTKEQEIARERIDQLLTKDESDIDRNLNLHILLDKDPRWTLSGETYSYIKKLIMIGSDVRFAERNNKMKLVLQEKELYLSFSQEHNQMVSIGYHYIGDSKDDGLCRYIADEFDRQFEKAQRLTVENDKIVLADPPINVKVKEAFDLSPREWAIIIIGLIVSFIIGLFLKIPFLELKY